MTGPPRTILDFISNMYIFNAIMTAEREALQSTRSATSSCRRSPLGTIPLAIIARMTRSSLLEVLGQDYVRTARAKGMKERSVVLRHGLRNAMLPVVTVIGLSARGAPLRCGPDRDDLQPDRHGHDPLESITGRDYIVIQGFA